MIDNKKIEEAANKHIETEYARYNSGEVEEEMICLRGKDSFKAGAKWAINELLKDLWHDASEVPDLDRRILYEYKPNGEINPPTHIREATYEKLRWKECGYKPINPERIITRWLYVDELFPKKGGNHD